MGNKRGESEWVRAESASLFSAAQPGNLVSRTQAFSHPAFSQYLWYFHSHTLYVALKKDRLTPHLWFLFAVTLGHRGGVNMTGTTTITTRNPSTFSVSCELLYCTIGWWHRAGSRGGRTPAEDWVTTSGATLNSCTVIRYHPCQENNFSTINYFGV